MRLTLATLVALLLIAVPEARAGSSVSFSIGYSSGGHYSSSYYNYGPSRHYRSYSNYCRPIRRVYRYNDCYPYSITNIYTTRRHGSSYYYPNHYRRSSSWYYNDRDWRHNDRDWRRSSRSSHNVRYGWSSHDRDRDHNWNRHDDRRGSGHYDRNDRDGRRDYRDRSDYRRDNRTGRSNSWNKGTTSQGFRWNDK